MAKATDFRFGQHTQRNSADKAVEIILKKGRGKGHMTPYFWALSANSSKLVKDTNFKLGMRAPMGSPDMSPQNIFRKGGVTWVTWP